MSSLISKVTKIVKNTAKQAGSKPSTGKPSTSSSSKPSKPAKSAGRATSAPRSKSTPSKKTTPKPKNSGAQLAAKKLGSLTANGVLKMAQKSKSKPVAKGKESRVWQLVAKQAAQTVKEVNPKAVPPKDERADDNVFQRINHKVTGGIRGGVGFVTDAFRDGVDKYAITANAPSRFAGKSGKAILGLGGKVAASTLKKAGQHEAADIVQRASNGAGNQLERVTNFLADQNEAFTRGLGESAAGAVDGVAYAVTDPLGTIKGIGQVVQHPKLLVQGYKDTAAEHGIAGALGHVTGDVLTSVFTGGGGAAAKSSSVAGKIATRTATRGGRVSARTSRVAAAAQSTLDDVAKAGAKSAQLRRQTTAKLEELRPQRTRRIPGPDSSPEDFKLDDAIPRVELADPGKFRSTISRAKRNLAEAIRGNDAERFSRRATKSREANPALHKDISGVRDQLEKLEGADTEQLVDFLNQPEQRDLARRLDAGVVGPPPSQVGDIVLSGRENILNYLRQNPNQLDPRALRAITRGLFADSEAIGPAFLTRLKPEDQVYRVFDRSKDASGGYYGRVRDKNLSIDQNRLNSALPVGNPADGGILTTVGGSEPTLALVTRVGHQADTPGKFAAAPGGNWQIQFLDNPTLRPRLKQVTADVESLPLGVRRHDPSEIPFLNRATPTSVLATQLNELNEIGNRNR